MFFVWFKKMMFKNILLVLMSSESKRKILSLSQNEMEAILSKFVLVLTKF